MRKPGPKTVAVSVLLLLLASVGVFLGTAKHVRFRFGLENAGFATWHGPQGRHYRSLTLSWHDGLMPSLDGTGLKPVCLQVDSAGAATKVTYGCRLFPRVRWMDADFGKFYEWDAGGQLIP